ncbi:MAG: hypothetical protein KIS91_16550 [Anaerolineae bacterium]|nr:hypothetical protein [Anaerolineae bacterium]
MPTDDPRGSRLLRASEVGRYAYCARAWWLQSVQGVAPDQTRLTAGVEAHARHGRRASLAEWQARAGLALLLLAGLALAWAILRF